jgi:hypothetical protein
MFYPQPSLPHDPIDFSIDEAFQIYQNSSRPKKTMVPFSMTLP